jgi:EAL domain-containing protein (putative c-di-GMP-specific phosphodiesterase class I)
VNISARQLTPGAGLVESVADVLRESGLDPASLVLEITESALMGDAEAALRILTQLKALGVRLAIDDFGTGYSSLVYLKRCPVDLLKIDMGFIRGLGQDPEDSAIVACVIGLARAVGIDAVAEGVETAEQLAALQELGCAFGQGYLWSRPVPAGDFDRTVLAGRRGASASEARSSVT